MHPCIDVHDKFARYIMCVGIPAPPAIALIISQYVSMRERLSVCVGIRESKGRSGVCIQIKLHVICAILG